MNSSFIFYFSPTFHSGKIYTPDILVLFPSRKFNSIDGLGMADVAERMLRAETSFFQKKIPDIQKLVITCRGK